MVFKNFLQWTVLFLATYFSKNSLEISPGENLLKLSDITYQLNYIKIPTQRRHKSPKRWYTVLFAPKNNYQARKSWSPLHENKFVKNLERHTGKIIPLEEDEKLTELRLSSSVVTVGKKYGTNVSSQFERSFQKISENQKVAFLQVVSLKEWGRKIVRKRTKTTSA